mmetsp:Transcript_3550/g.9075  ORF Transcript_3550/g.9075 Transcript_3550/m.9075 type:complete len:91 (-) Transcript_3550:679-951(-)
MTVLSATPTTGSVPSGSPKRASPVIMMYWIPYEICKAIIANFSWWGDEGISLMFVIHPIKTLCVMTKKEQTEHHASKIMDARRGAKTKGP